MSSYDWGAYVLPEELKLALLAGYLGYCGGPFAELMCIEADLPNAPERLQNRMALWWEGYSQRARTRGQA